MSNEKFVADEFEVCGLHGKYEKSGLVNSVRYSIPNCPKCKQIAIKNDLIAQTRIPLDTANCTFQNYINSSGTIDQQQVLDVCTKYAVEFDSDITKSPSIIMLGNVGTGKNHLSTAIVKTITRKGFNALHIQGIDYLDLYWGKDFSDRPSWIRKLSEIDLIVLDEVEKTPRTKGSDDAYFRLIQARTMNLKPTIVISNYSYEKLKTVITEAGVDRLKDYSGIGLNFNWKSYRGNR